MSPPKVCLPQSRVKTIMKSSPDVEAVSQESLFLITKATVRKSIRQQQGWGVS